MRSALPDSALPASHVHPYDESAPEDRQVASLAGRAARPSHWRAWLAFLAVLVALRLALPIFLAPLAEERLSRVLGARVEIGDVSFAPIDAVVTLHDVTVHAPPVEGETEEHAKPAIGAARVRIDVQWLPLLHRSVVVRELALESALIDPERFAGAGASLERLLRVDPATELPPEWTFALDRIVLRDTRLRLHDFGTGERPALDVGLRDAQVSTRQRRASAFKRAPNLRVDALVEGGRIRIDGSSDLGDDGVAVDARIRVKDVPLDRLQSYLPDLGWTAVAGRLSGQLHYQRDPERRDLLTGRVQLRRVGVRVPAIDQPALAIRRVEAEVDAIDLRHRRVAIRSLMLHGARLAVRADLDAAIPLLDGVARAADAPPAERPPRSGSGAPDAAWTWAIGHVATPSARLHVAGADGEVVLAAGASGENLGPRAYWSPLRAWVGRGAGVAVFDGSARMSRGLRIDGRLTARDVDAPALARAFGMPMAELAQSGRGSADLNVEIEPAATDAPTLGLRGKVAVDDVWLAGPEADAFAVGARSVHLTLAAIAPAANDRGRFRPTELRFADATVTAPYVLVTRTAAGWLLPPFAVEVGKVGDALAAALPKGSAATQTGDPERQITAPVAELLLTRVQSSGGRVLVVDRATRPEIVLDLDVIDGWAQDVRLPALTLGQFVLQAAGRPFGELRVAGSTAGAGGDVEVSAPSFPLAAAAPYLGRAGLPYWFVGGTGSLLSHIALAGGRWSADTTLTLREPRFGGDQGALQRSLGMPIEEALAALRDPAGDVTLQLPLASAHDDRGAAFDGMVATAFREGVARARQAPLPDAPIQIAFAHGRADLSREAARQLAAIADVLDARRDVVVELSSGISRDDRRGLAEQAAGVHLAEPGTFMGMLRAFGVRDQHTRIREALAARVEGYPGRLGPDDEAVLRELVAAGPPIDEARLAALAAARLRRVANVLADQHAISPARVIVTDPGPYDEAPLPPTVQARIEVDVHSIRSLARVEEERW